MSEGKMEFILNNNGVQADLPHGKLAISGDPEFGFRPFQLLVASVAGCSGSVFRKILQKQRIAFTDFSIAAEIERNPDEANRIERIHLHYKISGHDLNREKLLKNLAVARKNCAMVRSVEASIQIDEDLEVVELEEGN